MQIEVVAFVIFCAFASIVATSSTGSCSDKPSCDIDNEPNQNQCTWYDASLTDSARIDALLASMSLEEKVNVVSGNSCPRVHLDTDGFSEAAHGVAWTGRATVFPCSMGMAATFNSSLVFEMGKIVAHEGLAKHWGDKSNSLSFFAPNINIVRDVRWGRAQETYGEDPMLSGVLGAAYVRGMQFPNGSSSQLAVRNVAKHFAAYNLESNFAIGGTEGQYRLMYDANVSQVDLMQTYLPAFESIVQAGVRGVMCSYQSVNGTPMCANRLIQDELRNKMGFEGFVISDCGAIGFMISEHKWNHTDGTPVSLKEATAASLAAGTDLNCGASYKSTLMEAVNTSLLSEAQIETALRRNLKGLLELGLLQDTNTSMNDPRRHVPMSIVDSAEHRSIAKQAAIESVVLLKNDGVLPIAQSTESGELLKIAVVGPNANRSLTLGSNYAGCKDSPGGSIISSCTFVNPLQGIIAAAKTSSKLDENVVFAEGVDIDSNDTSRIKDAVDATKDSDVIVFVGGLITCQETGDQCIEAEARDRATGSSPPKDFGIGLPGQQLNLLKALAEADANIVLVLMSGSAVATPWAANSPKVRAIVQHFYSGALGGEALAEVLLGVHPPSGRLPVMIPKSEADLPEDYLDQSMTAGLGRTHRYFKGVPLFNYGFGMGYSQFTHSNVTLSHHLIDTSTVNDTSIVTATVTLSNDGKYPKPHPFTVILYATNIMPNNVNERMSVPNRMMVGFAKVLMKPHESLNVKIKIVLRHLHLVGPSGTSRSLLPGKYVIGVDCDSELCESGGTTSQTLIVE